MQRTESELRERYYARMHGIRARRRAVMLRSILDNPHWNLNAVVDGHFRWTSHDSDVYNAACKALGHWPRRESISPMEWRRDPR